MRKSNFIKAKEFVQSLISHFTVSSKATHFGIITYSTNSRLEFDFANAKYHDIVELKKRVMEISYPGSWTRTDKALEMAASKLFTVAGGDRNDKPNILIVLTDGKTNRGSKPYPEVLQPLQVSTSCNSTRTSFPGSLILPPHSSIDPGGGKIRDPGSEVGVCSQNPSSHLFRETKFEIDMKHDCRDN